MTTNNCFGWFFMPWHPYGGPSSTSWDEAFCFYLKVETTFVCWTLRSVTYEAYCSTVQAKYNKCDLLKRLWKDQIFFFWVSLGHLLANSQRLLPWDIEIHLVTNHPQHMLFYAYGPMDRTLDHTLKGHGYLSTVQHYVGKIFDHN